MKYRQRITAVIFLILILPVGLRCVVDPKSFYFGIRQHIWKMDFYGADYKAAVYGGIEETVGGHIPGGENWLDFYGGIQYLLDKNYMKGNPTNPRPNDTVVRLENHYLTFHDPQKSFPEIAPRVIRFNDFLAQKNIRFLYVQAPGKVCKTDPRMPRGMEDFTNPRADALLSKLNAANVMTLDLRDEFPRGGEDYDSLFFVGDNHYNSLGAFLAVQKTVAFINDRFDMKLDAEALLPERFSREDFRFRFTGSQRNRIGNLYTPPDSSTLLLPNYPTQFEVVQKGEIAATGSFEDIWVDRNSLADGKSCYGLYVKRHDALANSINKNTQSSVKILLVGDSFIRLFVPFLSLSCKENINFGFSYQESIREVVETYHPDLVIFLYCPNLRKDILEVDYPN